MRIALLGATGFVGQAAARELAARPEVDRLLLVDYNVREAKKFAKALSPRCRWAMADAGRAPDLARVLDDVDAVANAVGPCAEYEKGILLTCAAARVSAASIGDCALNADDLREIRDAYRRAGAGAVSGCGMMPGWTDLLAAHFLPGRRGPSADETPANGGTFLFFSPDRFGGYAFFRRFVGEVGGPVPPPACAPPGRYFEAGAGAAVGLPEGRAAGLLRGMRGALAGLGPVGREMSAAFLFWLRRSMKADARTPASVAGVFRGDPQARTFARVADPGGRLAGALLAETALALARGRGTRKGLLALPEIIGREEAERIASDRGGEIRVG